MTYWSLPERDALSLEYGNIFCTMPFPKVVERMQQYDAQYGYATHSVIDCIIDIKTEQLTKLRKRLQHGQLDVELRLGKVCTEDRSLLLCLKETEPDTVSWSNLCDFVGSPSEFHYLASTFEHATHFGYTMNWTTTTFGCCLSDSLSRDDESGRRTVDNVYVNEILKTALASNNSHHLLVEPAFETPLNHASYLLTERVQKFWLDYFFAASEDPVTVQRTDRLDRFALYRTNTVLYTKWNYESRTR